MADLCFLLDELTPVQALQVLAQAAETSGSIALQEILLGIYHTEFYGTTVTLFVPDFYTQRGNQKELQPKRDALDSLIEGYRKVGAREPRHREPDNDLYTLAQGVGWLMINSTAHPAALPQPGEYLLLARAADPERAATIVEDLRFHATGTHVTVARTTADQRPVHLFHLLDDPKRRSGFQGAQAGRLFHDCLLLAGFADQGATVFLPADSQPGRESLHYFCRLLQAAPSLFSSNGRAVANGLLAAIAAQPVTATTPEGAHRYDFYYLGGLSFLSQIELAPALPSHIDIEVHDLATSAADLQKLRAAIAEAEPLVAYRLALRPGHYQEFKLTEYERLAQQQLDLEYRLAYLSSIKAERPVLLRFTQQQLPALADVIRSMPMKFLQGEDLLYGFQAVERHYPAGLHYLLKSPHAVMEEMDPLPLWRDLDRLAMHFWLDPLWSRYYGGRGNDCWVFVPKGMTLSPPMHCWEATEMDAYLRAVLAQWFHGRHGVAAIPEKAIYLFEPSPHAPDEVHISVLDRANFQPLQTQLGWFNDNLAIMNELSVAGFIQTLADDIAKRDIAARVGQAAQQMMADFTATAERTNHQVAAKTQELTSVITGELNRIIQKTQTTTEEIRDLNLRLTKLQLLYDDMRKVTIEAEVLVARTEQTADVVTTFTSTLRQRVETTLADAQQARQEVKTRVAKEIDLLQQTHADLQALLEKLRRKDE